MTGAAAPGAAYPPPEYWAAMQKDFALAGDILKRAMPDGEGAPAISAPPSPSPAPTPPDLEELQPDTWSSRGVLPYNAGGVRTYRADGQLLLLPCGEGDTGLQEGRQFVEPLLFGYLTDQGFPKRWEKLARHGVPALLTPVDLPAYAAPDGTSRYAFPGMRLWFELVMAVPRHKRGGRHLLRLPVRHLIDWLWPDRKARSGKYRHAVFQALHFAHNCRIPTSTGYWSPLAVRHLPEIGNPDGEVVIEAWVAGDDRRAVSGPRIYRPALREWGGKSIHAWRLCLALAWLWNRQLNQQGEWVRDMKLLPWLSKTEVIWLATGRTFKGIEGMGKQARRQLFGRIEAALRLMAARNDVVAQEASGEYRLEPPAWWNDERPAAGCG